MQPAQQPQPSQQAPSGDKKSPLEHILQYKEQLEVDLQKIEKGIADMENNYFTAEHAQAGNVFRGFEGFLSSKEALRKRGRAWKPEDRLFSLSSRSSPTTKEMEAEAEQEAIASGGFGKKGYAAKGYAQKGYAQKGKRVS